MIVSGSPIPKVKIHCVRLTVRGDRVSISEISCSEKIKSVPTVSENDLSYCNDPKMFCWIK